MYINYLLTILNPYNMKEKENQPQFGTGTYTGKTPGLDGAMELKRFMMSKYGKDPDKMTKAEKKAFKKMAKELLEAGKIDREEYDKILAALK